MSSGHSAVVQRHRDRFRLPGLTIGLACLLSACGGITDPAGGCGAQVDTVQNSLSSYADSGLPIARLAFQQLYTRYPAGCRQKAGGPIHLVITSTADVPLAFSYQVRGYDEKGVYAWQFTSDIRRIGPGEDVDVGIIAESSARVDGPTTAGVSAVNVVQ